MKINELKMRDIENITMTFSCIITDPAPDDVIELINSDSNNFLVKDNEDNRIKYDKVGKGWIKLSMHKIIRFIKKLFCKKEKR